MKFRMAMAALAATMIALALTGCGGGGGGDIPSASVPFERDVADGVKAVDIVEDVAQGSVGGMGMGLDLSSLSGELEYIGAEMEYAAEDPYQGQTRGIGEKKPSSSLAIEGLVIYLAQHRGKQTRTPIDETTDDGWHWVGNITDTTASVTGTKSDVGSISMNMSFSGSSSTVSVQASYTASITRSSDGKLFTEQGSMVMNITETALSFTVTSTDKLAGVVVSSSELVGSATFDMDASSFEMTINGHESIVAEDGYWVNIAYNSWKITASGDDLWETGGAYGSPASGTMTFTASDGFSGTLTLSEDGTWTGVVLNSEGVQVATITGASYWTVDIGGDTTDVYF